MAFYDSGATYDSGVLYDQPVPVNPRRKMVKVKLGLKELDDAQLFQFAQQHYTAMQGNANFPTPNPAQPAFLAVLNTFETALQAHDAAQQEARLKTAAKDAARAALEEAFTQRAAYVDTTSGGNETTALSSGLPLRDTPSPVGPLPAPIDFLATMGDVPGEIDLMWSPVKGAKTYVVEYSVQGMPRAWVTGPLVTKSKATITGLISGQTYVFRVRAVGAAGEGPWSDESVKMAP
jgi:hypothetical protein